MKTMWILWNVLTLMAFQMNTLEIRVDPRMKEGEPSYIYCDVGTVTAGVSFSTEPDNVQGSCFAPGVTCTSILYNITQNTTGVLLEIDSVDASRENGEWFCKHDTGRSTNTISLNEYTISGHLVRNDFTKPKPPGKIDSYTATMVLSCTYTPPLCGFSYTVNGSSCKPVPKRAESTITKISYNGETCWNGKKFYEITLTASNNIDAFNNKEGVKFKFTYYEDSVNTSFSVNFREAAVDSNTTTTGTTDDKTTLYIVLGSVVGGVFIIIMIFITLCCCVRRNETGKEGNEHVNNVELKNVKGEDQGHTSQRKNFSDVVLR